MKKQLFYQLFEKIQYSNYILIVTHKNPDADTLGSALALGNYLDSSRKKYKIYNQTTCFPKKWEFLKGLNKITNQLPKQYDLIIYVDCSEEKMVGIELTNDIFSIAIDHHQTTSFAQDLSIIDSTSGSTGELVYNFFEYNNIKFTKDIATPLYVAIYEDTVGFTTPRTTSLTFGKITRLIQAGIEPAYISNQLLRQDSLAKYRAIPRVLDTLELHYAGNIATVYCENQWVEQTGVSLEELDFISNMVLNIAIVKVSAYFRMVDNKVRVSLRGKSNIDLSDIAKKFNGGGHKDAAGFNIETLCIEEAKEEFLKYFKNHIFD